MLDLLKDASKAEVDTLRAGFGAKGLKVRPFVQLVLGIEDSPYRSEEDAVSLFNDVDARRDGVITWDQFSTFLIDYSMMRQRTTATDDITGYSLESIFYDEIPNSVKKLYYFSSIDKVGKLVSRGRQSVVKLCKPLNMAPWKVTASLGAPPLCAEVIPAGSGLGSLAVSCSDMSVSFWESNSALDDAALHQAHRKRLDESQVCLRWSDTFSRLLSGSRSGLLSIWAHTADEPSVQNCDRLHSEAIMDIVLTENMALTASLDSTVKVIDVHRGKVRTEFKGHQQGVYLLAYCAEHSLLASAGYEYDPYIWMVHMAANKPCKLQDKRRPHRSALVGLEAIPDTPQLISADQSGMIKLWDIRTFRCVQTFVAEAPSMQLNQQPVAQTTLCSVCSSPPHKRILLCGRTLSVFKYDSTAWPQYADDRVVCIVAYNPAEKSFLTSHGRCLKLWDSTGALAEVYREAADSEITACCVDPEGRRFFLGTAKGVVTGHGWATGKVFLRFTGHQGSEVLGLAYVAGSVVRGEKLPGQLVTCGKKQVWVLSDAEDARPVLVKCFGKALEDSDALLESGEKEGAPSRGARAPHSDRVTPPLTYSPAHSAAGGQRSVNPDNRDTPGSSPIRLGTSRRGPAACPHADGSTAGAEPGDGVDRQRANRGGKPGGASQPVTSRSLRGGVDGQLGGDEGKEGSFGFDCPAASPTQEFDGKAIVSPSLRAGSSNPNDHPGNADKVGCFGVDRPAAGPTREFDGKAIVSPSLRAGSFNRNQHLGDEDTVDHPAASPTQPATSYNTDDGGSPSFTVVLSPSHNQRTAALPGLSARAMPPPCALSPQKGPQESLLGETSQGGEPQLHPLQQQQQHQSQADPAESCSGGFSVPKQQQQQQQQQRPVPASFTGVAVSPSVGTVLAATDTGLVVASDMATHRFAGFGGRLHGLEARCLSFLADLPFAAFTDNDGRIHVTEVRRKRGARVAALWRAANGKKLAKRLRVALPPEPTLRLNGLVTGEPPPGGARGACFMNEPELALACQVADCDLNPDRPDSIVRTPLVSALSFDPNTNELYTGDEKGWLAVYNLADILQEDARTQPGFDVASSWRLARVTRVWLAHYDEVSSVQVLPGARKLVTAGYDTQVLVWTTSGILITSLQQGRIATPPTSPIRRRVQSARPPSSRPSVRRLGSMLRPLKDEDVLQTFTDDTLLSAGAAESPMQPVAMGTTPFEPSLPAPTPPAAGAARGPSPLLKGNVRRKRMPDKFRLLQPTAPPGLSPSVGRGVLPFRPSDYTGTAFRHRRGDESIGP
ncbi:Guanine nucleotide-binding protein subunit beta-like protein [Diplonema papillatum]|nr:Guanine nucleotide-binding protein subunit beta-like protein [Diplonema papillatum]